jgi:flagellar basal-body rod protein FlgG
MIMAQRAYEINSKAIQTSDEMLQTANGIKR